MHKLYQLMSQCLHHCAIFGLDEFDHWRVTLTSLFDDDSSVWWWDIITASV